MLRLEDVQAGYPGHPVLHRVSLTLEDGQRKAILGRNGAGKTTLLRTIVGALRASGGELTLDGADLGRRPAHLRARAGIAYVPQGRGILRGMTVRDNLRVAAVALCGRDWSARLDTTLDAFPLLGERQSARADSLSGGQQQLLALARALLCEPRILILDEPTEGIQPSVLDELAETVLAASRRRGMAVLVAEQNLEFAARLAEGALVMEKGRISAELPTRELHASRDLQRQYLAV